ncbi:MAG: hypothetical protein OET63_04535 [Desulfobacterales bacterium]|nr:hypothetical protein [Desulfobacterales bacterium]
MIEDQVGIADNILIQPIFLKEEVARIGGVEKVEERLICQILRVTAPRGREKSA